MERIAKYRKNIIRLGASEQRRRHRRSWQRRQTLSGSTSPRSGSSAVSFAVRCNRFGAKIAEVLYGLWRKTEKASERAEKETEWGKSVAGDLVERNSIKQRLGR